MGKPYVPVSVADQTPELNLVFRLVQAVIKLVFDQLEDWRRGLVISDVRTINNGGQIGEETIIWVVGSAGQTVTLPKADHRGRGRAQVLWIQNITSGNITLAAPGGYTVNATTSTAIGVGQWPVVSNGIDKWRTL